MPNINLAPLDLGELLDQTFSTFRKRFWLFSGIMVFPEGVLVGLSVLFQVYMRRVMPVTPVTQTPQAAAQSFAFALRVVGANVAILIPYYIVYALALGAITYALSEVYLGRDTTIREAYRVVANRFWRLLNVIISILLRTVGIFVLVFFLLAMVIGSMAVMPKSMLWVAAILVLVGVLGLFLALVLMVIFMLRYSVAVPALVLEKLSARQALKRSVALTKSFLWRLLLIALLMTIIRFVLVLLCQAPFSVASVLIVVRHGQPGLWLTIPSLLLGGVAGAATAPLLMISFAIAYYDFRVRKEGFDLQLMMADLDASAAPGSAGYRPAGETPRLEDASIPGIILWTVLTGGIYAPIWFLVRRRALNRLNSPEKVGVAGLSVALAASIADVGFPIVGSSKWGSWVEAENHLGPLHPVILLAGGFILIYYAFKVRNILLDHLAPRQEGMFAASIRIQYEDLFSRLATFFLGIFYLQHKINGLVERLTPVKGGREEVGLPVEPAPAPPLVQP